MSQLTGIGVQAAGAAFNALVSFLLLAWLARGLGPAHFGDYVSILSAAMVMLMAVEGGWAPRLYRATAAGSSPTPTGAAVGHALAVGGVLAAAALALAPHQPAWAAALACMACVALANLASARLRGSARFGVEAAWQAGGRLASALAIVAAVAWIAPRGDLVFTAWAVALAVLLLLAGRRWLARPDWRAAWIALPVALPWIALEVLQAVLFKGDAALLRAFGAGGQTLADFAACTRFSEAALLLYAPVANVSFRTLVTQAAEPARFARTWRGAALGGAACGAAAVAGSLLASDWLVVRVFGAEFASAAGLLPYTAALLPFALATLAMVPALLARGEERTLLAICAVGAALMAFAAWLGLASQGVAGAALGVAFAHAVVAGLCLAALSRPSPAGRPLK